MEPSCQRIVNEANGGRFRRAGGAFLAIPEDLARSRALRSSAKLLLARILALSRKTGACYASQQSLAQSIGLSERQVRRLLTQLEREGYIRTERSASGSRFRRSLNRYIPSVLVSSPRKVEAPQEQAAVPDPICGAPAAAEDPDIALIRRLCGVWAQATAGRLPVADPEVVSRDPVLRDRILRGWQYFKGCAEDSGKNPESLFEQLAARASASAFLRGARSGFTLTLPDFFSRAPSGEFKWQRLAEGCYDDRPGPAIANNFVKGQVSLDNIRMVSSRLQSAVTSPEMTAQGSIVHENRSPPGPQIAGSIYDEMTPSKPGAFGVTPVHPPPETS